MIDFKLLEETVLLFWDTQENFHSPQTQLKIGNDLFKAIILIDSLDRLKKVIDQYTDPDQKFLFAVHLNHANDRSGYYTFRASKIQASFPNLQPIYVSSAPKKTLYEGGETLVVFSYTDLQDTIGTLDRKTKKELTGKPATVTTASIPDKPKLAIEYGIITALYKDEFQAIEKEFEWLPEEEHHFTGTNWFKVGHVSGNPAKRIVAVNQTATGMVDAAIIAALMLEKFAPKYIFMSGVCGGLPGYNFGSIIIASKVFTFQKGKVSDVKGEGGPTKVFDKHGNPVEIDSLYDEGHNRLNVAIEHFHIEHDFIPDLDPLIQQKLEPKLKGIQDKINRAYDGQPDQEITIEMAPMACSTMVIDRKGYFQNNIKEIDRKTLAVEMEGYGVARACRFANNGSTKWVIFKAVMDNMTEKDDKWKKKAAYTSAQLLKYILEDNIL